MTRTSCFAAVILAAALGPARAAAAAGVPDAEEIVRKSHQAFFSAGRDMRAKVSMRLVNKEAKERRRGLTMLRLNAEKGGRQKYYIHFHEPADVRGTGFLIWKYPDRDDDRWLYIPAIHLVSRIAARDRHSSFVGSDFTYEDVSGRDLGLDSHRLLREETFDGADCYVVESVPKEESAFTRKVSWIGNKDFLPRKEEYYDAQKELFRVFTAEEIKDVGGVPTIVRRRMANLKTGHFTETVFADTAYGVGLEDQLFTERYLRRPPKKWIK